MVWFQCEDCGDNLKKPKLPNHFRCCRASRFSCIDCGAEFDQQSVQQHTQCISEAEKYGPKGQGQQHQKEQKANGKNNAAAPSEEVVARGLSTRPPWSCSLCNVKATGKETLLVHGHSKRHVSRAKAAIAAAAPKQLDPDQNGIAKKQQGNALAAQEQEAPVDQNGESEENQQKKKGDDQEKKRKNSAKEEQEEIDLSRAVKWRKLIKCELKKAPDGCLKRRKLEKSIIPVAIQSAKAAGIEADATLAKAHLRTYLGSTTKFSVKGKRIQLAGAAVPQDQTQNQKL